jgi:hypothetical protein
MERDKNLQRILLNKEISDPSDGLDDMIMRNIEKEVKKKSFNNTFLYLAWIFLTLSLTAGLIIATNWVEEKRAFSFLDLSDYSIVFIIIFSFVFLLLFERLFRLSIDIKKKYINDRTLIAD